MSRYHQLAHFKDVPLVKEGERVEKGQLIGYIGNTGHSTGCHIHYGIFKKRPPSPYMYSIGKSDAFCLEWWENPEKYIKNSIPAPNDLPYNGYQWFQKVKRRWGGYYRHVGIDINSYNDCGKPIYSPVNGVVYFVTPKASWTNRQNKGWGNMLVIEEVEVEDKNKKKQFDAKLAKRLEGSLLLQVEKNGELWYVQNKKRFLLGTSMVDYKVFMNKVRNGKIKVIGIKNKDIEKIQEG